MPDAAFAVDHEVERDLHQIRHIGRRDDHVARRLERLAIGQRAQRLGHEVVPVPRPEECTGADHEGLRIGIEHAGFGVQLAAPVDAQRIGRIGFDIRRALGAIEHQVARERHEAQRMAHAGQRQHGRAQRVFAHAALAVGFGLVNAHEAARIDDRPRLETHDCRVDRGRVGDVHLLPRKRVAGQVARFADALEGRAQRAARARDQDRLHGR